MKKAIVITLGVIIGVTAKFARPKKSITKQAGEDCIASRDEEWQFA